MQSNKININTFPISYFRRDYTVIHRLNALIITKSIEMKTQTRSMVESSLQFPSVCSFVSRCSRTSDKPVDVRMKCTCTCTGAFTFAVHVRIQNAATTAWESSMFPIPSALRSHRKTDEFPSASVRLRLKFGLFN